MRLHELITNATRHGHHCFAGVDDDKLYAPIIPRIRIEGSEEFDTFEVNGQFYLDFHGVATASHVQVSEVTLSFYFEPIEQIHEGPKFPIGHIYTTAENLCDPTEPPPKLTPTKLHADSFGRGYIINMSHDANTPAIVSPNTIICTITFQSVPTDLVCSLLDAAMQDVYMEYRDDTSLKGKDYTTLQSLVQLSNL